MNTKDIGTVGEDIVAKLLKRNRYKIVERNVHISHNEIDIVARNKKFILFVEVKTRSTSENSDLRFGTPASAVDERKQKRTVEAARGFLKGGKYSGLQPRFDVAEVFICKETHKLIKINYIENAFGA